MTAENVSNSQLLEDIKNTEIEVSAYDNIAAGFWMLSQLPENERYRKDEYLRNYNEYYNLHSLCEEFLKKLYEIEIERRL